MTASTGWRSQSGSGRGRFARWRSIVCLAWSRSPCGLGFAGLNPVAVPSRISRVDGC